MRCRVTLLSLLLAGGAAHAWPQTPTPTDTTTRRLRVDATALRPGQWVYAMTVQREGTTVPVGSRTVSVAEVSHAGTASWLLIEQRTGEATAADSLTVARADLRPLHWASTIGRARLVLDVSGDSASGVATAPTGRRSIATTIPPGTLINQAMLETLLRLLPLAPAWQDSTVSLLLTVGSGVTIPTYLTVSGEASVSVPAGTFDCWVVVANAESVRATYWVTKKDPMVVQSTQPAGAGGAQLMSVLTRRSP